MLHRDGERILVLSLGFDIYELDPQAKVAWSANITFRWRVRSDAGGPGHRRIAKEMGLSCGAAYRVLMKAVRLA
jgi:hypothetical protein